MRVSEIKRKSFPILKAYGVQRAGIFGSGAAGKMGRGSDVDILVKLDKKMSLFGISGLKIELEKRLGKPVDIVEYSTIRPKVKKKILSQEVQII